MGGPIPWTALDQYASRYGIAEEQYDALRFIVRGLEKVADKHEKEKAGAGHGSGGIRTKNAA